MNDIGRFFRFFDDYIALFDAGCDVPAMMVFSDLIKQRQKIGAIHYDTLEPLPSNKKDLDTCD